MNFPVHNQGVKLVILLLFGIPNLNEFKKSKSWHEPGEKLQRVIHIDLGNNLMYLWTS